ncbi:autoinducer binding domain-containing protein [Mesorhizobium silamurunense]|uniref:autoinducer binding domain-containing protein n=1 Tax=Mesorhizobium silamurunense TaxID=499528 RepID=UPI00177C5975|nr:autoinducer binding domain-containing protein [Mesorhizobium silamurunense]
MTSRVQIRPVWYLRRQRPQNSRGSTEKVPVDDYGLSDAVRALGFDCYAYLNIQPVCAYSVSNYANEWPQRYFECNYKDIDPVVRTARAKMEAFAWAPERPKKLSFRVRALYAEEGNFGIRLGIAIPIRTAFGHMSMLTVASHKTSLSLGRDIDQLAAVTASRSQVRCRRRSVAIFKATPLDDDQQLYTLSGVAPISISMHSAWSPAWR